MSDTNTKPVDIGLTEEQFELMAENDKEAILFLAERHFGLVAKDQSPEAIAEVIAGTREKIKAENMFRVLGAEATEPPAAEKKGKELKPKKVKEPKPAKEPKVREPRIPNDVPTPFGVGSVKEAIALLLLTPIPKAELWDRVTAVAQKIADANGKPLVNVKNLLHQRNMIKDAKLRRNWDWIDDTAAGTVCFKKPE